MLTLSLLGYLKTKICSKSHVWCPNMTNTSLESSCALLLESAKTICKFAKIEFFIAISSYIVKMFAKKNLSKKWKIIHFWKALDHAISNMQKFCKILNNLIFNQEKLKMCKFPLKRLFAKMLQFFSQNLCNSFPYAKGFPKS